MRPPPRRAARRQVRRWSAAAAALAAVPLLAAAAPAQASGAALRITGSDVGSHPAVTLTVAAPQPLLPDVVAPSTFTVTEAGRTLPVDTVAPVTATNLDVVAAIDTSGSMVGSAMPAAQQAARSFLETVPAGVDVAVLGFGPQPRTAAGFGSDREQLAAAVDQLIPSGETALFDALIAAVALFPDADADSQRVVVLLSDGGDTVSDATVAAAEKALQAADATLYAVELASPENDPAPLARLAQATGGQVVAASDPSALDGVYRTLAQQLVSQYRLRYTSVASGAAEVQVALTSAADVAATTTLQLPEPAPSASAQPPAVAAPPAVAVDPGWWAQPAVLIGSVAVVAVALVVLFGVAVVAVTRPRAQLASVAGDRSVAGAQPRGTTLLARTADRSVGAASGLLARFGFADPLNTALERAGISLRPGEYTVVVAAAAVAAAVAGAALLGGAGAVVLVTVTVAVGWVVPRMVATRRQSRFDDQLPDVLQLMAGSLRVGHGLLQAVDTVAREADSPASDEFQRVVLENRLGRDLAASLRAMADRVANADFAWVVQAIEINRDVGGDLAAVLDTVAGTIRERQQLRRHVKSLTAEGRLSAVILVALPFVVSGVLWLVAPDYVSRLGAEPAGRVAVVGALVGITVGAVWIRNIVKLKF